MKQQTLTRDEAARLIEIELKKFACAFRDRVRDGASDYEKIVNDDSVWCWLSVDTYLAGDVGVWITQKNV